MSYGGHKHLHNLADRVMWRCSYCRRKTHCGTCEPDKPPGLQATRDHVIPRVHGGRGGPNLVLACKDCNNLKADGQHPDYAAPRMVRDPAGCYPNSRSRNGRMKFGTEANAQATCDEVLAKHGRRLEPYECPKCSDWHVRSVSARTGRRWTPHPAGR